MRNSARQHCSAPSSQSFAPPFLLFQNRCVANRLVAKIVAQSAIPQNVAPMYARQNDIQKHHAKSRSQKKQEGQLTPLQPNKQPNNQPTQTPLQSKSKSKNKKQKHTHTETQKKGGTKRTNQINLQSLFGVEPVSQSERNTGRDPHQHQEGENRTLALTIQQSNQHVVRRNAREWRKRQPLLRPRPPPTKATTTSAAATATATEPG